ncbi:protein FAM181B [Vombatus ursinus]|uniref:Family with sequence similarity 181 member B n=1 Tax=Vombatus ursinus TaxID=29139 RepID=A0A4X2KH40_VOMUR|nr:protein FAM181B [Vombatus ursinus]
MAVQAAILSPHHFIPFCFPGSPGALGMDFGDLDKGCCYEEDETGGTGVALLGEAVAAEAAGGGGGGGDFREATRDLLSFIDSASSNIKLALDKPVKSKRKVNHRKYLQKQIKRCTGMMTSSSASASGPAPSVSPSPGSAAAVPAGAPEVPPKRLPAASPTTPGPQGKAPPKREGSQAAASLQSKSLAALFESLHQVRGNGGEKGGAGTLATVAGGGGGGGGVGAEGGGSVVAAAGAGGGKKVPLRNRNLPPSFFTEPSRAGGCGPSGGGVTLRELEKGGEAVEFFELLSPDYCTGGEVGGLLPSEPLDLFPAAVRAPQELEHIVYDPHPTVVAGLLYSEPWSTQCPPAKKPVPASNRGGGGLTLNETLRALYPGTSDSAASSLGSPGGEDTAGHLTPFSQFFPDCALPTPPPPHQMPYDYGVGYSRVAYSGL